MTDTGAHDGEELASLTARIRAQRRHLDGYEDKTTAWSTKLEDWAADEVAYDRDLMAAGARLGVPPPRVGDRPRLTPRERATMEERLAAAGLDVREEVVE